MKKIISSFLLAAAGVFTLTGCIEEATPQSSVVSADQAANAPGSFDNFVGNLTDNLAGKFIYGTTSDVFPYDYGYPSSSSPVTWKVRTS